VVWSIDLRESFDVESRHVHNAMGVVHSSDGSIGSLERSSPERNSKTPVYYGRCLSGKSLAKTNYQG
jgi:hypothetical protein